MHHWLWGMDAPAPSNKEKTVKEGNWFQSAGPMKGKASA